jgi:hypothetical protein
MTIFNSVRHSKDLEHTLRLGFDFYFETPEVLTLELWLTL